MAEAAGLSLNDFNLQGDIPFVEVRKHPWRNLKTSASARVMPLSGMACGLRRKYCNKRTLLLLRSLDTIVDHIPVQVRRVLQLTSGLGTTSLRAARCIAFDIQCGTACVLCNALRISSIKSEVGRLTESGRATVLAIQSKYLWSG